MADRCGHFYFHSSNSVSEQHNLFSLNRDFELSLNFLMIRDPRLNITKLKYPLNI